MKMFLETANAGMPTERGSMTRSNFANPVAFGLGCDFWNSDRLRLTEPRSVFKISLKKFAAGSSG